MTPSYLEYAVNVSLRFNIIQNFARKRILRFVSRFSRNRVALQAYRVNALKILWWTISRANSAKIPDFYDLNQ